METSSSIRTFWNWFLTNTDRLFYYELYDEGFLAEGLDEIQKVHPDLVFEIGPELDGKRDFIISANGLKGAFSSVIELSKAAPQFDNWNIIAFRQRKENFDMEVQIDDIALAPQEVLFDHEIEKNRVNVNIYINDLDETDERVYHIVFLLLDNLIGEYDVEMKIGKIDIFNLADLANDQKLLPLQDLPKIVDSIGRKTVH